MIHCTEKEACLFGGRFRSDSLVKDGCGIETMLGTDLPSGRRVVIKTAPAATLSDDATLRLDHEAKMLAELGSPWLVPLLAVGREGNRLYLVTPYVPGVTLQARLAAGALSLQDTLSIGRCLLQALHDIHRLGVLHRDIKPANLIVNADGPIVQATVIDFGLARSDRLELSIRDLPVGTVQYVAPEQAGLVKYELGAWSDLYSAGVLLFECLAGRPPFQADSIGELLRQHLTVQPPRLRALGLTVPRALDEILQRLLQKAPQDRYQTAEAVLADWTDLTEALVRGVPDPVIVIGAQDRRRTLTEPAFIGRDQELAEMETRWQGTRRGAGGLMLVEAESGGGKTWLLDELAQRCERDHGWVLRGQGRAQAAQRPFQLLDGLVEALIATARSDPTWAEALRHQLGDQAEAIAAALPPLAEPLGLNTPGSLGPEAFGERRSLRALATLLEALGTQDKPALVLLDDCQWADDLTIKLLQHWQGKWNAPDARQSQSDADVRSGCFVLVVAACRSEEVPPDHPLRRLPACEPLQLSPFDQEDMRKLVESMAGPVPKEVSQVIARLAAGSPFMASAVLHGLVETGALAADGTGWQVEPEALDRAQASYRAAVFLTRRLERLPAEALRLLSVGAVLGKEFELKAARTLAGLAPDQVIAGLEEARRRHLVWVDGGTGCCSFVHDKIRDACLLCLSETQRRELHRQAALYLEAQRPDQLYDLAYHFDAAGEPERALPYALAAAELARRQFALELAERQYRIAERGASDADATIRYRIAEGLGDVLMLRGRYDQAQEQFERARALADTRLAQAQIEGKLGELAFKRGDVKAASEALERALRVLGQRVPQRRPTFAVWLLGEVVVQVLHTWFPQVFLARRSPEKAEQEILAIRLYSRLAYVYWFQRGTVPCFWAHLRELNLAERYPPTPELAQAYSEHAPAMTILACFSRGVAYVEKSLAMRKAFGDIWGQGQSLHFYGLVLYAASRFSEAVTKSREAVALLERTGDCWEANNAGFHIAFCLYRMGELRDALSVSQRVHQVGLEIGDAQASGVSLEIWSKASAGNVPVALVETELQRHSEDAQTLEAVLQAEGVRLLGKGDPSGAVAVFQKAQRLVERVGLRNEYVASILPWLATAIRHEAEKIPAWEPRSRQILLRRAQTAARKGLRLARSFHNNLPHALRECGLLAAMRGCPRRALKYLNESLAVAERQGARYEYAQTLLARGRVGLVHDWPHATDDAATAERLLAELRAGLEEDSSALSCSATLSLADRFAAVQEVGRSIAAALSPEAVFAAVQEGAMKLLRGERCLLFTVPEHAEPGAATLTAIGGADMPCSQTLIHQALTTGRPVVVTEGLPAGVSDSAVLSGVRSALCAPILVRGRPAGCFYVTHRHVDGLFGEDEVRLAEFIATLAGTAFENAASFVRIETLTQFLHARTEALEASEAVLRQAHEELEHRVVARTAALSEANARLIQEVHERQRTETALRESEERYRAVAETAAEAIITMDETGIIVFANRATEQIFGYAPAELLGQPLTLLMPDRLHAQHRAGMAHYLATGQRRLTWERVHLPGRHKTGQEIPLELAFWEFTQQGRRFFSSLVRDITDQVQATELRARFLEQVMSAQEEERRRLARELHDETGQALMALLVQLHSIRCAPTLAEAQAHADEVQRIAAQTLDEVRRLAIGLRPSALDDLGPVAALERYAAEYTKAHRIPVDLHVHGLESHRLPVAIETTLYRIIQEALTNVAKHARATLVSIVLERQAGWVQAVIEDNGCGFDVEATLRRPGSATHLGLHSMRERAALVNGTIEIESSPNRGSTIYVKIPSGFNSRMDG